MKRKTGLFKSYCMQDRHFDYPVSMDDEKTGILTLIVTYHP